MISITFQSATAYLIDNAPDWNGGVELRAEIPTENNEGLTKREDRRPLGDTLRLSLRYQTLLQTGELPKFRNSLQALTTHRVLCPFWPYGFAAGASPEIIADYYVLIGDGSVPEIKTHAQLPFARPAYPMLVGMLASRIDPALLTDETAPVEIDFVENDTWSITLPEFFGPDGLTDGAGMRPLFPFRPNWASPPQSGAAEVEIDRRDIGPGRKKADTFFTQPSRRRVTHAFTLTEDEPWQLLQMFKDHRGGLDSFWLPAGISDTRLTFDTDPGDGFLIVDDAAARGDNKYFVLDDLTQRTPFRVDSNSDPVTWIIGDPVFLGAIYRAGQARIESLILARFERASITLRFENQDVASCSIEFIELPWEEEAVSGETFGLHMGSLPTCAYLYRFTIPYPSASTVYRFTNFERDLTNGGNTYTKGHWSHESIIETAILERHQTSIHSRNFAGNPLALLIPFALEWPLQVEIIEVDVNTGANTASNLRTVFIGEVESAEFEGPNINATCKSLSPLIDRRIPRWLMQPHANCALFDPKCGLNRDDWKWQGTVSSFNAGTMELALSSVSRVTGSAVTLSAHYFAGGFLVIGSGASQQVRMISDSTVAVGSALTLVIASPFTVNPAVSSTVFFHPGCDGRYAETCIAKFNNGSKFVGFPFMPPGNPSLLKVSKDISAGGKK